MLGLWRKREKCNTYIQNLLGHDAKTSLDDASPWTEGIFTYVKMQPCDFILRGSIGIFFVKNMLCNALWNSFCEFVTVAYSGLFSAFEFTSMALIIIVYEIVFKKNIDTVAKMTIKLADFFGLSIMRKWNDQPPDSTFHTNLEHHHLEIVDFFVVLNNCVSNFEAPKWWKKGGAWWDKCCLKCYFEKNEPTRSDFIGFCGSYALHKVLLLFRTVRLTGLSSNRAVIVIGFFNRLLSAVILFEKQHYGTCLMLRPPLIASNIISLEAKINK